MTTCWPPSTRRGASATSSAPRPQPDLWLTDITEHRTGRASCTCARSGLLLEQDRGLLHRLADEVLAGGVGVAQRVMLRDPQGTIVHSDQRQPISLERLSA